MTRPPEWTLRRGHPDLCPGSGDPCLFDPCYRNATCRVCGARTGAEPAHTVAGGGRVAGHYPRHPVGQLTFDTLEANRG